MKSINPEILDRLYNEENLTQKEIASRLEVTQSYISRKMKEYELESDYPGFWSEEEKSELEENYRAETKQELITRFEDRSWNSIKLKAMEIGVAKSAEEHRNSDKVKSKLRELAKSKRKDINFEQTNKLSYILGVVDGDGFHDNKGSIGLEVTNTDFADKFEEALNSIGLNPGRGKRNRSESRKELDSVWASSTELINWLSGLDDYSNKLYWLSEKGSISKYVEGRYESDGNIHPSGSPRICSYDSEARRFIQKLFTELGIDSSLQQNNVWVSKSDRDLFFEKVDPVLRKKGSKITS